MRQRHEGYDRYSNGIARRVSQIPILVQANAGLPHNIDGADVYPETPEIMASFVGRLIDAAANIIGGCCGTTPGHHKGDKSRGGRV